MGCFVDISGLFRIGAVLPDCNELCCSGTWVLDIANNNYLRFYLPHNFCKNKNMHRNSSFAFVYFLCTHNLETLWKYVFTLNILKMEHQNAERSKIINYLHSHICSYFGWVCRHNGLVIRWFLDIRKFRLRPTYSSLPWTYRYLSNRNDIFLINPTYMGSVLC